MPATIASNVTCTENLWVALPDGRRLAARLWLPDMAGPLPAILEYLPYRKRDGTAFRDETTHPVFAASGYACLRVDIAGTGDSDGQFDDEYSEQELSDGEAVLSWMTSQDWCDGNIGMIGISWGGFNGLQLAYRQPPALKAIVTVASTADRYADDIHYMGGCMLSDNVNWSAQMQAYLSRPADPDLRDDWRENWITRMEEMPDVAAIWIGHPTRDNYWKHGSVCEDWAAINIPILAITGWADSYVNTPPLLAEKLAAPCKALIGPWEHRYPHISKLESSDFHSEVTGWFDRWLKGEQNGTEDLPVYRSYMQKHFNPKGANHSRKGRWIAEENWPSDNVKTLTLYPDDTGLGDQPGRGQKVVATPAHVGQASGYYCPGMRIDNELAADQAADDALSVVFDYEVGPDPLELLGRARFEFSFSSDQPVAQLVARLCDVSPEGVSQRISYRALNLTHHASHEQPEALISGQVYTAVIELNECAHHLRPGHILRLALSNSYWPIVWPGPVPAAVTLDLAQSSLRLPVREATSESIPCNPGPARDFPTLDAAFLRNPSSRSARHVGENGTRVLDTFDDFGCSKDPYHGLINGSHVTMRYAIHPDDPASATFSAAWEFTFARGEWQVEICSQLSLTCDANKFYLKRKLRAIEGPEKTEVFVKSWEKSLPRGLL